MQALDEQLIQKYENLLLKAQQYKMPEREMTIFDTALKNHHENPITELLAFFLDPNEKHGLDSSFYDGFIGAIKYHEQYSEFEFGQILRVITQQSTDKGNRIDLWFETDTALVIVEVKVYHIQNNPFKDYMNWGRKKIAEINKANAGSEIKKQLVTVVFSPSGESSEEDWYGISYSEFTAECRQALGAQIIQNPLNKWGIFARDFLLHLNSFMDLLETNMESLKFVVDNMQKIQDLVVLRDNVYQEIINHINNELQTVLGEEYDPGVRWHTWDGTPALRFVGNNWNHWTETVLNLHINNYPMSCSITIYIDNHTDEIIKKVKQALSRGPYSQTEPWFEKNNRFWAMRWELKQFDLDEVTQQIVFLHKILNRVELEWK